MKKRNKKKKSSQGKCTRFSVRASLIAIGQLTRQLKLFDIIEQKVKIAQKTVKHSPVEKLIDALISILAGAKGLVEVNKRVRSDSMLQLAFGRRSCAEQSTISQTLNAVTDENVAQMSESLKSIYRQHSRGANHDYHKRLQLLDVDMSGLPAGKKAELASKGYFAKSRNRRGRQIGRVVATHYQEVVVSQLYDGKTQLTKAQQPLILAAEEILSLSPQEREKTIIRTDAGGGSDKDINFLLQRGYLLIGKAYSSSRAKKLCACVTCWYADPKVPGREVGLVTLPHSYCQTTQQIGVRAKKKNGKYSYHLLVCNLSETQLQEVYSLPRIWVDLPEPLVWLALGFYDLRGGGIETEIKADKQGLGLTKRNKKKFAAQQMLVMLADLAHNLCIWAKRALAKQTNLFDRYGIFRLVRDVFTIAGKVIRNSEGQIRVIILNKDDPLAYQFQQAIAPLLSGITVNLGKI